MKRYLIKFYYIGSTKFYGSQRQNELNTVENCLLKALQKKDYFSDILNSGFEVASRTDRFVSARGAVFSFSTKKKLILMEINSILPKEIGVWAFTEVSLDFSSRYKAVSRHYKYIYPQSLGVLQKRKKPDLDLMRKACKELEGTHDFVNFSKNDKAHKSTVKNMDFVDLTVIDDYIVFDFLSRSFLRQQIRRMVKKIFEVGMGELSHDDFLKLFNSGECFFYQPADPTGLVLWDIIYDNSIKFEIDLKSKERMDNNFQVREQKYGFKHQLFRIMEQNNFR